MGQQGTLYLGDEFELAVRASDGKFITLPDAGQIQMSNFEADVNTIDTFGPPGRISGTRRIPGKPKAGTITVDLTAYSPLLEAYSVFENAFNSTIPGAIRIQTDFPGALDGYGEAATRLIAVATDGEVTKSGTDVVDFMGDDTIELGMMIEPATDTSVTGNSSYS